MRLFWYWLVYQACRTRWLSKWIPTEVWAEHGVYCPKCEGCGYWECCMPCKEGIFCAKLYTAEDKRLHLWVGR